jgi:hypothetical protein
MTILMFCKDVVRNDPSAYQSFIRAKIPEWLALLSEHCAGFERPIDPTTEAYANFMRVVDKRNFALHGNVDPMKEPIEIAYFDGRRPLFNRPGNNVENYLRTLERFTNREK